MAGFERLSLRIRRQEAANKPVIHIFDQLPERFRLQAFHILTGAIGEYPPAINYQTPTPNAWKYWDMIREESLEEFGLYRLVEGLYYNRVEECREFLLSGSVSDVLDFIEIAVRVIEFNSFQLERPSEETLDYTARYTVPQAIEKLNSRFAEHDLGYRYYAGNLPNLGMLARADSEFMHSEVLEPAILALNAASFRGALEEFLAAHKHFRRGENKVAISEASKAFESTLKAICHEQHWEVSANATATPLVNLVIEKGLVPPYLDTQLSALRTLLTSALPPVGNRNGRHGQGPDQLEVPDHFAAFALHLAAANILFLVESHYSKLAADVPF